MSTVRLLCPAGDLRDGDMIPTVGTIRWIRRGGGSVAFSSTNEDAASQWCLGDDMEIWVEREVTSAWLGRISPFAVPPLPHVQVHR